MTVNRNRSTKRRRTTKAASTGQAADEEDRISGLPEDIRVIILSFLGIKDAVRTSILSKIWRYTWTYLDSFDFGSDKSLGWHFDAPGHDPKFNYVDWVNQVLKAHRSSILKKFRVRYHLDATSAPHINEWVNFCLRKGVQELDLNFLRFFRPLYYTFGSMWKADLPHDVGMIPTFTNLRSFCVVGLNISGALVELMLSRSLLLERLCLTSCKGLEDLKVVSSLQLKHLAIENCDVDKVEVSAPNLVTVSFKGRTVDVVYKDAPSLVEANFCGGCVNQMIDRVFGQSFQLKRLSLILTEVDLRRTTFPVFANLKQLAIQFNCKDDDSLLLWSYLIDACPSLRELKLEVWWPVTEIEGDIRRRAANRRAGRRRAKHSNCMHPNLEVVHFRAYAGYEADNELISYLVKRAPMLRKLTLDPRSSFSIEYGLECSDAERMSASRRRAGRLVKKFPDLCVVVI